MKFLNNLKVGTKLGILIFIAFVALAAMAGLGYYEMEEANKSLNEMYAENFVPNDLVSKTESLVYASNGRVLELMLTTDAQRNQVLLKSLADYDEQINKNATEIAKIPMGPKGKELFARIKGSGQAYRSARTEVVNLAAQNKNAEAYALYGAKVIPAVSVYVKDFQEWSTHYSKRGETMSGLNPIKYTPALTSIS